MRRVAQPLGKSGSASARWSSLIPAIACAGLLIVSGCGSKGFNIEDAVPDRSLTTGSIGQGAAPAPDATALSDESTIRNAVSSALVEPGRDTEQGWANASTGSRGDIRGIAETRDSGRLCRDFEATRESYQGIHLYRGQTCAAGAGDWVMTSYDRVE